jgi:peptidoglycan/xylan/chitin deacetylase (PgdA/CDA1 family)
MVREGHRIGLHSDVHERLDRRPENELRERLGTAKRELERISGVPIALFRPPFGRLSLPLLRAARQTGLNVVLWSLDPRDWHPMAIPELKARISACMRRKAIVLLHDGSDHYVGQGSNTAAALRSAMADLPSGSPRTEVCS